MRIEDFQFVKVIEELKETFEIGTEHKSIIYGICNVNITSFLRSI